MDSLLQNLKGKLSPQAAILTANDKGFDYAVTRWTELDKKIPSAVIQPTSEDDVVATVKEAAKLKVPFVTASGGHSQWSSIGKEGFVLDLERFKKVDVDASAQTASIKGGVLMKELQIALNDHNLFTGIGNANTVGVIPYFLGGGLGSYSPLVGYACESLLSARLVTSSGTLLTVSPSTHPDLLWALRGAGQFFGVVTEITIRAYPLSMIPGGCPQTGIMFFPVDKAVDVVDTIKQIVQRSKYPSSGLAMITNTPDGKARTVMVSPIFFGSAEQYEDTFKPLMDLGPNKADQKPGSFLKHTDHLDWLMKKGGLKRISYTGVPMGLDGEKFAQVCALHEEIQKEVPGAEKSSFQVEWHSPTDRSSEAWKTETSFGNKGVDVWLNEYITFSDEAQTEHVLAYERRVQSVIRQADSKEDYVTYTNTNRDDPVEWRYSKEAVPRLRKLKEELDPEGVFSREFLGEGSKL